MKRKETEMKSRIGLLFLGLLLSAFTVGVPNANADQVPTRIEKKVKHELNMLPYVNVFDYMEFTVDANGNVTLMGEVTNPMLKSDGGNVGKRVEGVEKV